MTESFNKMSENENFLKMLWQDLYRIRRPVLIIMLYWILTNYIYGIFCPLKIFCGYPCPCCGITRAYLKMLQWKWKEAFIINPMAYAWLFVGSVLFIQRFFLKLKRINVYVLMTVVCIMTILVFGMRMQQEFPTREPYTYYENNIINQLCQTHYPKPPVISMDKEK